MNCFLKSTRSLICFAILTATLFNTGSFLKAEEKAARKRGRLKTQNVTKDVEAALAQPCKLEFNEQRVTLGELLEQVAKTHGLQVRVDKNLAGMMAVEREYRLVAEGEIPGKPHANAGSQAGMKIPFAVQLAPTSTAVTLTQSEGAYAPVTSYPQAPQAVSPNVYQEANPPQPVSGVPTYAGDAQYPVPENGTPQATRYQANKPVAEPADEAGEAEAAATEMEDIKKQLQLNSRVIELFLDTEISTVGLNQTNASLESVLFHVLDHVTTIVDVMNVNEGMGLPAAPTHAYDLTLLHEKDHVLITTVLASNLRKTTKVYPVAKLEGIDAEALRDVITKSIRPWSWRSQVNSLVNQVSADWPESIEIPNISIDLAGVKTGESADGKSKEPSTEIDLASLKTMGQLLSSGAVAAVHTMISGTEMLHYADPPTADIEVLPGLLVVTQSQGAHREIKDLLEQLEDATASQRDE
ncbi:superantigen-like protein SSL4 [Thalassoglobus polymorphus]|uniref:Uncharacterized protein n=1 Tax=Thalassoglobus polymorphus TaxID=2527994 RepID=A0A517QLQ1_9PLAN|nr:hypothetical protein [Thalassoglobus polymorphus]QDT32565.1 hypothetical protein Mal48_18120 [Thalassoglobus polymorphus]